MQNNICPECKTENEPEYRYCKNCGAPVFSERRGKTEPEHTVDTENPGNSGPIPDVTAIDGNPIDIVATFVGKNTDKIIPKFIKLEQRGVKTDWCWPPFIWGFFLGPIGVAIWFLYRKMYKPACLFGGIAVVLNYITAFLKAFFKLGDEALGGLDNYINSYIKSGIFDFNGLFAAVTDRNFVLINFINTVTNAVNLASAILIGIFGIYMYKKHVAERILRYRPGTKDPTYFKIGLAASGGTSPGAAILGAIIISFVSNIPNMIITALKFVEAVYKTW
ncbi:MAG: hypothetical protein J5659_05825 [Clostridia bacterium]|nr:hypothetical protein [Clostridia bacterium]